MAHSIESILIGKDPAITSLLSGKMAVQLGNLSHRSTFDVENNLLYVVDLNYLIVL